MGYACLTRLRFGILILLFSGMDCFSVAQDAKPSGATYTNDGQTVTFYGSVVRGADPKTFTFISDYYSAYGKDATHVYLQDKPIPGADPATFAVIPSDGEYAKDAPHVF